MSIIDPYCEDTIYILKYEDIDKWGQPETRKTLKLECKIHWKTKWMRTHHGEDVTSVAMIQMNPKKVDSLLDRSLSHNDRILIEGEEFDHQIVNIAKPKSFGGVAEVYNVDIV